MLIDSINSSPTSSETLVATLNVHHGSAVSLMNNATAITTTTNSSNNNNSNSNNSSNSSNSDCPLGANPDRLSNVSLLGKKYLLFDLTATTTSTNSKNITSCVLKCYQRCVKVETREPFSCKMVARTQEGLQLIAGYHRLDTGCEAISQVHEVILSPKSLYLIMPPTFGNVHAYLLAKKKLREPEAANIFKQMVTAVQFCHSKGIVLRDLKMGKFVFHDRERTLVRLDTLEDAVLLNDLSDDGLSDKHGCPNYVSPEKAEILRSNKKYPGKATDMWGLGVILYTLLVGRYPFNDEDHSKLFVKIRRGHYNIPDGLSGPAKCLIRCLLQKDPSARPSCGEILNHSWINSGGQGTPRSAHGQCRVNGSGSRSQRSSMPSSLRIESSTPPDTFSPVSVIPTPGLGGNFATTGDLFSSSSSSSHNSNNNSHAVYMDNSATSDFSTNYNLDFLNTKVNCPQQSRNDDQVVPCIDSIL